MLISPQHNDLKPQHNILNKTCGWVTSENKSESMKPTANFKSLSSYTCKAVKEVLLFGNAGFEVKCVQEIKVTANKVIIVINIQHYKNICTTLSYTVSCYFSSYSEHVHRKWKFG
jgi:hypothetical protein